MNSNKNRVKPENPVTDFEELIKLNLQRQETNNLMPEPYKQQSSFNKIVQIIKASSPKTSNHLQITLKRSTTEFSSRNKQFTQNSQHSQNNFLQIADDVVSQDTQKILNKDLTENFTNINNSYNVKKSKEVLKVLQSGLFSEKENMESEDISGITQQEKYKNQKSILNQTRGSNRSIALLSVNQKNKIMKKRSFTPNKRAKQQSSETQSFSSNVNKEKRPTVKDLSIAPLLKGTSHFPRSKSMFPKKRNPDSKIKAMAISELKEYIMSSHYDFREKAQKSKLQKTLSQAKITKKQKQKDDNDSEIHSSDCEENKHLYRQMVAEEKEEHMKELWKKAFIKAKAADQILTFFDDLARKIYLFGVSKQLDEIEQAEKPAAYIIMPHDKFKTYWTLINVFMLLYTATYMPYKTAFIDDDGLMQSTLDYVIDILFGIDMLVNFFSAYEETDGSIVSKQRLIVKKYLKSWFFLDFVACFPFQLLEQNKNAQGTDYQKLLRLLRLPRLYRFIKVMKILKQIKALEDNQKFQRFINKLNMNAAIVRMIQGMITAITITHLFACFWFLTSKVDGFTPETWVYRKSLVGEDPQIQYLYSLYWSTQTVITVGYGDIPSKTVLEMLLSLIWMLFGVAFYSFIIGNYSSIITSNFQIQASIEMKVKSLSDLTKKADIPFELSRKIKKFIENNYEQIYNQDDEVQLTRMLPPSLRDEILNNTFGEVVLQIKFFQEWNEPDFLWRILSLLRPIKLEKGDILYWRGDHAEDIYFIMRGTIKLYTEKGYPYIKYKDGEMFGDSDALLNLPRDGKAIATTHLKLQLLKFDQSFQKKFFENQQHRWMQMLFQARSKRDLHLRLIGQANKKARIGQAKIRNFNLQSAMTTDVNYVEKKGSKNNLFGSIKSKIANIYKGSGGGGDDSLSNIKHSYTANDPINPKFLGIFQSGKSRQKENSQGNINSQNDEFVPSTKTLKSSSPNINTFQSGRNQLTIDKYNMAERTKSSGLPELFNFKDQYNLDEQQNKIKSQGTESIDPRRIGQIQIKESGSNINEDSASRNLQLKLKPLDLQFYSQESDTELMQKLVLPKAQNAMVKSIDATAIMANESKTLAIPEIKIGRKKQRMSILDQILTTAFKREKLADIYLKYPFLAQLTNDEDANRNTVMVPHHFPQIKSPRHAGTLDTSRIASGRKKSVEDKQKMSQSFRVINFSKIIEPLTPQVGRKSIFKQGLLEKNHDESEDEDDGFQGKRTNSDRLTIDYKYNGPRTARGPQKSSFSKLYANRKNMNLSTQQNNNASDAILDTIPTVYINTHGTSTDSKADDDWMSSDRDKQVPMIAVHEEKKEEPIRAEQLNIPILKLGKETQGNTQQSMRMLSPSQIFYQQIQTPQSNTLQLPQAQLSPQMQKVSSIMNIQENDHKDNSKQKSKEKRSKSQINKEDGKYRTSSMRVVVSRPSFSLMRNNSKDSSIKQKFTQQTFISPLSLMRIQTDQLQSRNNAFLFNAQTKSPHQSGINLSLSPVNKNSHRSTSLPKRDTTLQEKISLAMVRKQAQKRFSNQMLKNKEIKNEENPNNDVKEMQTFSNVLGTFNINDTEEEIKNHLQMDFLDDQLLNNQKEEYKNNFIHFQDNDDQSTVNDFRTQIFEEIKRKFSKNISTHQSRQESSMKGFSTMTYNNNTYSNNKAQTHVSPLSVKNFDPIVKDEEIEFFGDPAVVNIVQFNADMSYIALNIFETFNLFDLAAKGSQAIFENLQLIESQNSIIGQRQEHIHNKLDEIEQQLLIIQQLKNYKIQHSLAEITQEMRY